MSDRIVSSTPRCTSPTSIVSTCDGQKKEKNKRCDPHRRDGWGRSWKRGDFETKERLAERRQPLQVSSTASLSGALALEVDLVEAAVEGGIAAELGFGADGLDPPVVHEDDPVGELE